MGWFSEIWFRIMAAGRGCGNCRRICLRPHPGHKLGIVACHIWTHLFGGKTPPCNLCPRLSFALCRQIPCARLEQAFVEPHHAKRCRGTRRCAQEHTVYDGVTHWEEHYFQCTVMPLEYGARSIKLQCSAIKASGFAAAACCC